MKTLILAAVLLSAGTAAVAQVSVTIGQPGFYGRIDIGDYPAPQLIYAQPVIVQRPQYYSAAPIYLRVPPGHANTGPSTAASIMPVTKRYISSKMVGITTNMCPVTASSMATMAVPTIGTMTVIAAIMTSMMTSVTSMKASATSMMTSRAKAMATAMVVAMATATGTGINKQEDLCIVKSLS